MWNWQIFRYCSCWKRLIGKLVLVCEDEILNTTKTSLDDKEVICEKSNYLIHTILMVIICLLLVINLHYYYAGDWIKKTCRIILVKRNNLKEINIKNWNCYYFNDIIKIEDFDIDIFY